MPEESAMGNFHALLIGVDHYLDGVLPGGFRYPSLEGCVRDVNQVEGYLTGILKVRPERITKLTSTDPDSRKSDDPPEVLPTYENIALAIMALTDRAAKGDLVFIHYSGHGGQATTNYPNLKGTDGVDEGLVPYNIVDPTARYVRDLEIAALLQAMTTKGLRVSLVFDCCHSGGVTRGEQLNQVGVRGVDFIDRSERPRESLVKIPEGLSTRGLSAGQGLLPDPKGYTLLAACSPFEKAREFPFDGKEKHGALTYWFLDALRSVGPSLTYKRLHDRVLSRIHSQFPSQTPMLQGEMDRVVFGVDRIPPAFTSVVREVDQHEKQIRIGAGQASGVRKGARFAVYPPGADLNSPAGRKAVVEVVELGAIDSVAGLVTPEAMPVPPIEPGDPVAMLGAGSASLVRRVRTISREGLGQLDQATHLKAVDQTVGTHGSGWVELSADQPADFVVTLSAQGDAYEICDTGVVPIKNLRPAIKIGDADAAQKVVSRLVHLAKYRAVQDLDNFDDKSKLKGKLVAELVGWQDNYTRGDRIEPKPFTTIAGQVPTLKVGQTTWLRVRNELPEVPGHPEQNVLNVTVLDLEPGWGISMVHPVGADYEPLAPGREIQPSPGIMLKANLQPGYTEGTDILKVLATIGPSNFRVLELPKLDQPDARRGERSRSATRGTPSALGQLLEAVAGDQPGTRELKPPPSPSDEWTMVQIEVKIVR
jgi:hypothetical protein